MSDEDYKFNKIDDAIQKLAVVASDLSRMIAVHEQRLSQQEKASDSIGNLMEKRREEIDKKFQEVYDTIREEDHAVLEEIRKSREASDKQHKSLDEKISRMEKMIWMAIGGGVTVGFLLSMVANYLRVLH
jgi:F0F1-type ATP synthase alpha subunit